MSESSAINRDQTTVEYISITADGICRQGASSETEISTL